MKIGSGSFQALDFLNAKIKQPNTKNRRKKGGEGGGRTGVRSLVTSIFFQGLLAGRLKLIFVVENVPPDWVTPRDFEAELAAAESVGNQDDNQQGSTSQNNNNNNTMEDMPVPFTEETTMNQTEA